MLILLRLGGQRDTPLVRPRSSDSSQCRKLVIRRITDQLKTNLRHEHLDDPRRTEWKGFPSGTRAATAGGLTTLVDMPLNSFPSTVAEEAFELKKNCINYRQ
ncbi:uncharacterized protein LOC114320839 [Camellia sinensis]|uniref:uncharacterized protein LOC114320839 n=1 Tax=Camellia sinensis TaxID=4442 RepID=UPI001036971D|nr:uncharacterized protein LOC114320839 [Camellia sinensis]